MPQSDAHTIVQCHADPPGSPISVARNHGVRWFSVYGLWGLWALGLSSRSEEGLRGPRSAPHWLWGGGGVMARAVFIQKKTKNKNKNWRCPTISSSFRHERFQHRAARWSLRRRGTDRHLTVVSLSQPANHGKEPRRTFSARRTRTSSEAKSPQSHHPVERVLGGTCATIAGVSHEPYPPGPSAPCVGGGRGREPLLVGNEGRSAPGHAHSPHHSPLG